MALSMQSSPFVGLEKSGRISDCSLCFSPKGTSLQVLNRQDSRSRSAAVVSRSAGRWKISYLMGAGCVHRVASSAVDSENSYTSVDEALILKKKSQEVVPYMNGHCIYLVGEYHDKLVEQAVGATSVAQIFKEHGEAFFRQNESKVLHDLSLMQRLVVATGGGAVVRPINWRYMKQGITIWLDVPLEALARRIAAVGTDSRPLLHQESGDPYTKAFTRLMKLSDERADAYANAHSRVCLQSVAVLLAHEVQITKPTSLFFDFLVHVASFISEYLFDGKRIRQFTPHVVTHH
ncbi:Shikimate kinase [Asimina triloba]